MGHTVSPASVGVGQEGRYKYKAQARPSRTHALPSNCGRRAALSSTASGPRAAHQRCREEIMKRVRYLVTGAALATIVVGLGIWRPGVKEAKAGKSDAPTFTVDWKWPKALPHRWLVGQVAGVAVDQHDRIWIIQRPRTLTEDEAGAQTRRSDCCYRAPSVLQLARDGNLLRASGGPHHPRVLPT